MTTKSKVLKWKVLSLSYNIPCGSFLKKKYAYCKSSSSNMLKLNKYKYFYCCNVLLKVKCTCNKWVLSSIRSSKPWSNHVCPRTGVYQSIRPVKQNLLLKKELLIFNDWWMSNKRNFTAALFRNTIWNCSFQTANSTIV